MRGSNLRNLLTIQREVKVGSIDPGSYEANTVWQDWHTDLFCGVEVRRGREHWDSQTKQRYSEEVWRFRVRYDEVIGIDASMRIKHEGMKFDIKAILPDGEFHHDCIIECTIQNIILRDVPLSISIEETVPLGFIGEAYDGFVISVSGGTAPYVFTTESGTLPQGLQLDAATGAVTGTPTTAGTFSVDVSVTDANGAVATLPAFTITVD